MDAVREVEIFCEIRRGARSGSWHWVVAALVEGVAAGEAFDGEPGSSQGAVGAEGFEGVPTAGWVEAALAAHDGREGELVEFDEGDEGPGEDALSGG